MPDELDKLRDAVWEHFDNLSPEEFVREFLEVDTEQQPIYLLYAKQQSGDKKLKIDRHMELVSHPESSWRYENR